MIEFGLMRQLTDIVTVTDARMERILCRARWPLRRLGSPRAIGKTIAVAGYLEVSRERLACVREAGGLDGRVTRVTGGDAHDASPSEAMERRCVSHRSAAGGVAAGDHCERKRLDRSAIDHERGCRSMHGRRRVRFAKPVGHGDP